MITGQTPDYLGELSPGVMVGVVSTGLAVMAALVASCWLV